MGDTWYKLKPEETKKVITIKDDGEEYERELYENCIICYATEKTLVGRYGTDNTFGTFHGICLDCLKKLNVLANSEEQ